MLTSGILYGSVLGAIYGQWAVIISASAFTLMMTPAVLIVYRWSREAFDA